MAAGDGRKPGRWSNILRQVWKPFLTRADKARITAAIAKEEARTTGEIRVHIIARAGRQDVLQLAKRRFILGGLHKTTERNGVLILIASADRKFAIWGDEGLHAKTGQDLWERARDALAAQFAQGRYVEGIEACVHEVGNELARHFPNASGRSRNEIPNEVIED